MKTQEELKALKKEYEELNNKLLELSEEELVSIAGGHSVVPNIIDFSGLFPPTTPDDLGLINSRPARDAKPMDVKVTGSLENRNDSSEPNNQKPLF